MSRNMIKFPSMVLMMKLPRDCDIPLLFKELSGCEELLKPLRRNEKVILNGFMKSIRYPQKTKVSPLKMFHFCRLSITIKIEFPVVVVVCSSNK
jgi:hypothetical protein